MQMHAKEENENETVQCAMSNAMVRIRFPHSHCAFGKRILTFSGTLMYVL